MRAVLCAVCVSVAIGVACAAPARSIADRAQRIEGRVWSPYCPGRLLIDCTTDQARALRAEITHRLGTGQSESEVLGWIRLNFGDEALASPSGRGTFLVWSFPIAVLLIGGATVAFLVRRWTRRGAAAPSG